MRSLICMLLVLNISTCQVPSKRYNANTVAEQLDTNVDSVLHTVYEEAGQLEFLRSFLVWQDSKLVAEQYFQPYTTDSLDHVRSVTKSIISILIGIAIDQQLIDNVNDPVVKFLGDRVTSYSKEKQQITIEHLLTMSSGFQWDEDNVSEFNNWARAADPLDHLFSRNLVVDPGTTFNYNSGGPHILSLIITEVSGMSTLDFARRYLFDPLGIEKIRWRIHNDGYYSGGASLEIAPSDLMKIGIMMLHQGNYQGKQIVSSKWVTSSVKQHHVIYEIPEVGNGGYGYLWWNNVIDGKPLFQAKGYGGQYLVVVPKNQTVITITSQWQGLRGRRAQYIQALDNVLAKGSKELIGVQLPQQ